MGGPLEGALADDLMRYRKVPSNFGNTEMRFSSVPDDVACAALSTAPEREVIPREHAGAFRTIVQS